MAGWNYGSQPLDWKVRPLYVDTRLKEDTAGVPLEVRDRLFVVRRRVSRERHSCPTRRGRPCDGNGSGAGGFLVDRVTGRVSQINPPEFDSFHTTASWYRDSIAYCGVSDDGKKLFAIVAQLERRKSVLRKPWGAPAKTNRILNARRPPGNGSTRA